jgi:hypothetical protein
MHDPSRVAGVWHEMKEDDTGLFVRGELADTELGNEMRTLLKMKAVRGLSIGYRATDTDYDKDGNRLLKEVDLWEVSLVSLAMNPMAKVEAVKSRLSFDGEYVPTPREFEHGLRDAGYSRKVAKSLTAKLFDPEPVSGTLPDSRLRDAESVESDEMELLKSINRYTDKVGAAALSR